jgi:uncharacterized protein YbbC (DUF1343 family)
VRLARELNALALPGVRTYPVRFRPSSSRFAGELCEGVFFVVTDRDQFRPVRLGLEVAAALLRLFGDRFDLEAVVRLFGSASVVSRLRGGDATWEIAAGWAADEEAWRRLVTPYLIYE